MTALDETAISALLDKALAERRDLDAVIFFLSKILDRPVPDGPGSPPPRGGVGGTSEVGLNPVDHIKPGSFHGLSSTAAAAKVLARFGDQDNPISTKVIFAAIRQGGVHLGREEALYTSLARSNRFKKVAKGMWGLMEWYGPKPPRASKKGGEAATSALDASDAAGDSDNEANREPEDVE